MLPRSPAVELIDPNLLAAQVIWVPRVVLNVNPEISIALLGLLGERGDSQSKKILGAGAWLRSSG